jgi:hypothetical protein
MSAEERLILAQRNGSAAGLMVATDPHLAQDLADGEALRRLREALPDE